jgi:hypothetical protein
LGSLCRLGFVALYSQRFSLPFLSPKLGTNAFFKKLPS